MVPPEGFPALKQSVLADRFLSMCAFMLFGLRERAVSGCLLLVTFDRNQSFSGFTSGHGHGSSGDSMEGPVLLLRRLMLVANVQNGAVLLKPGLQIGNGNILHRFVFCDRQRGGNA